MNAGSYHRLLWHSAHTFQFPIPLSSPLKVPLQSIHQGLKPGVVTLHTTTLTSSELWHQLPPDPCVALHNCRVQAAAGGCKLWGFTRVWLWWGPCPKPQKKTLTQPRMISFEYVQESPGASPLCSMESKRARLRMHELYVNRSPCVYTGASWLCFQKGLLFEWIFRAWCHSCVGRQAISTEVNERYGAKNCHPCNPHGLEKVPQNFMSFFIFNLQEVSWNGKHIFYRLTRVPWITEEVCFQLRLSNWHWSVQGKTVKQYTGSL